MLQSVCIYWFKYRLFDKFDFIGKVIKPPYHIGRTMWWQAFTDKWRLWVHCSERIQNLDLGWKRPFPKTSVWPSSHVCTFSTLLNNYVAYHVVWKNIYTLTKHLLASITGRTATLHAYLHISLLEICVKVRDSASTHKFISSHVCI